MTKRYKILQKKVKDLEADLASELTESRIESILSQFAFLHSYLAAEIASSPPKPAHLFHIHQHLTELRAKFDERVSGSAPVETRLDMMETGSGCSCTESCLNDDGDSELEQAFFDLEPNEDEHEKEEEEEFYEADPGRVETVPCEELERCNDHEWGNNSAVLVCGVVIGAVLMGFMGEFYGCFFNSYTNYQGSLVPT